MTDLTSLALRTLFAYHWQTSHRLAEVASRLSGEELRAPGAAGPGSVLGLFFHLLDTQRGWRIGLQTGHQPPPLTADAYPDLASLTRALAVEEAAWQPLLQELDAEALGTELTLTGLGGRQLTIAYWRVLHHLILHGMQHHAELAQLLTAKGHSPGNIDFLFFSG